MRVDWSKRAYYIGVRHGISVAWADEAVNDRHAVWQTPDPASLSGLSVRVIGYSPSRRAMLTVILVSVDAAPDDRPRGDWCLGVESTGQEPLQRGVVKNGPD